MFLLQIMVKHQLNLNVILYIYTQIYIKLYFIIIDGIFPSFTPKQLRKKGLLWSLKLSYTTYDPPTLFSRSSTRIYDQQASEIKM